MATICVNAVVRKCVVPAVMGGAIGGGMCGLYRTACAVKGWVMMRTVCGLVRIVRRVKGLALLEVRPCRLSARRLSSIV